MSGRFSRGRRILGKVRRGRGERAAPATFGEPPAPPPPESVSGRVGWDHTAKPTAAERPAAEPPPLRARLLSLFADPRVDTISIHGAAAALGSPAQDIETTLDAMVQAGELHALGGAQSRYRLSASEKQRLEAMFRDAATELGEHGVLARTSDDALARLDDETEEPRLPVTAGLLSLFLPGTGQLLNGDVGRASLVFAVWSLAWITHLSPVWTFVCLYAGAEAFFTAKIRSMERKMAKEALLGTPNAPQLPPPRPSST